MACNDYASTKHARRITKIRPAKCFPQKHKENTLFKYFKFRKWVNLLGLISLNANCFLHNFSSFAVVFPPFELIYWLYMHNFILSFLFFFLFFLSSLNIFRWCACHPCNDFNVYRAKGWLEKKWVEVSSLEKSHYPLEIKCKKCNGFVRNCFSP